MKTFYQELRNQSKLTWRTAYTAEAIASWIREGFALDTATSPTDPPPLTSGSVTIRAKSSQGSEQMSLWVDGQLIKSWTVATTPANYTYEGYRGGALRVTFDNDGGSGSTDRNLAVNYLLVCGTLYESNAPGVVRTGCGVDNDRGFAWLWCQGSFNFGDLNCNSRADLSTVAGSQKRKVSGVSQSGDQFHAYPNPATEQLTIEATDQEGYQLTLYDLTGRPVMQHKHLKGSVQLNISPLRPGVYVVDVLQEGTHQNLRLMVE